MSCRKGVLIQGSTASHFGTAFSGVFASKAFFGIDQAHESRNQARNPDNYAPLISSQARDERLVLPQLRLDQNARKPPAGGEDCAQQHRTKLHRER